MRAGAVPFRAERMSIPPDQGRFIIAGFAVTIALPTTQRITSKFRAMDSRVARTMFPEKNDSGNIATTIIRPAGCCVARPAGEEAGRPGYT
ncbi:MULTISPECIES: hypothetical protein [unclassified Frankia]|uniref:hypothetical protein n=1 Tax=unclassified Frankia TaxID=2632575 RepID=UPI0013A5E35A|nr:MULTISPECIES: hypothetical protein [unclassified Frankia]